MIADLFTSTTIADPGLPSYSTTGDDGGDDSGDDSDDDDDNDEDDAPVCDYSITFDNLDDLNAASGDFVSSCLVVYALETLITMLDTAYANYTSVNDGYDEEFGYYVTYIEKLVPAVLDNNFMFNESITTDTMLIPAPGYGMNCTSLSLPLQATRLLLTPRLYQILTARQQRAAVPSSHAAT